MNEIPFYAVANLTRDPDLRHTTSGRAVASLSLATTPRRFDNATGTWTDGTTTFVDGTVWVSLAEHAANSLHRGDQLIAIGRWVTQVYTPNQRP